MARWSDHYTRKAREAGYAARSVFKLEEVERRARVLPWGGRAVDLGCAPGSWSRFLLERGLGRVVGVDLSPMKLEHPRAARFHFLRVDVFEVQPGELLGLLGGPAQLVLSDMAPSTTGNRVADQARQLALARRALELARALLAPGGNFVCKLFEGPEVPDFVRELRADFREVRRIRPKATRKHSTESFAVARGYRGPSPAAPPPEAPASST